jgi:hypothetical protein
VADGIALVVPRRAPQLDAGTVRGVGRVVAMDAGQLTLDVAADRHQHGRFGGSCRDHG